MEADPGSRVTHIHLIQSLQIEGRWSEALEAVVNAKARFVDDFNLDLLEAKTLTNLGRPQEAAAILGSTHVLPSENARASHQLWAQAHTLAALDALDAGDPETARDHLLDALEWPEHLGQGRPYQPEERLVRFILGHAEQRLGNETAGQEALETYLAATGEIGAPLEALDVLAPAALRALNRMEEASDVTRQSEGTNSTCSVDFAGNTLEDRLIRRALMLDGGRP